MSKESQIFNLRGLWTRIKSKMGDAEIATLNAAKAYADMKFGQIETFQQEVVQELPAQGAAKTLYFVPSANDEKDNIYDEFVWVASKNNGAGGYEQVGSTAYTPDHSVVNNDAIGKLEVTIGGVKYVIPREVVIKPATPKLKDGNTEVSDNDGFTNTKSLTLTCSTEGAEIRYTLDGSAPTASSTKYTSALSFAQDTDEVFVTYNLKAAAFLNGAVSDVLDISVKIYRQVAAVTFSPAAGTTTPSDSGTSRSIELSCATDGASIYYTTNGNDPSGIGTLYTAGTPILISSESTIKAIAFKSGWRNSNVGTNTYKLALNAPTISVNNTNYDESRTVTITFDSRATTAKKYKIGNGEWQDASSNTVTIAVAPFAKTDHTNIGYGTTAIYAYSTRDGWEGTPDTNSVSENVIFSRKCYIGQTATLTDEAGVRALANSYNEATIVGSAKVVSLPASTAGTAEYVWFAIPSSSKLNLDLANGTTTIELEDLAPSDAASNSKQIGGWYVVRTTNKLFDGGDHYNFKLTNK